MTRRRTWQAGIIIIVHKSYFIHDDEKRKYVLESSTMSILDQAPGDTVRVLDDDGKIVGEPPALTAAELVEMYRFMKLGRHFDTRAVRLQHQGRMGTYASMSGQEGAQVGSCFALGDSDYIVPTYREHIAAAVQGHPLEQTLRYWMGSEQGSVSPTDVNVFPVAIPIASQIPHATGAAWAGKMRADGEPPVFLCYFGDGATSEGDFHEGLNFAGVFDTPSVFFCSNNQWAISTPRDRQTASETLAQKAIAYGFSGVQVDGMDPLAVYKTTQAAVDRARDPPAGELRPTMIEAVMYRFGAHTAADDQTVYREQEEVDSWKQKDPIPRLETYLRDKAILDDDTVATIEDGVEKQVAEAIDAAEAAPQPHPDEMFDNVYQEPTPELESQREILAQLRETHGDEAFLE
ncbi:MAG: pyruvate dehydrogenase E1 component, alpha subunit [Halorubrum sp. J07HR59]|nr:MAG: pyruvate dehydrogenase E1 component, alpha subunit [Halorubrum sp. J07HR59]